MEMFAHNVSVIRDLGEDVWEEIRSTRLSAVVKLGARCGAKCRRQGHEPADELIGILDAYPHRPMMVGVISDAELGSAGIGHAYPEVLVLIVGERQIGGYRTQAISVWGQPTPCLSPQEFPLTTFEIAEVKA